MRIKYKISILKNKEEITLYAKNKTSYQFLKEIIGNEIINNKEITHIILNKRSNEANK